MHAAARLVAYASFFMSGCAGGQMEAVEDRFQPWPREDEAMTLTAMANAGLTRVFEALSVEVIDPEAHLIPVAYRGDILNPHTWDELRLVDALPVGGDPTEQVTIVLPSWSSVANGDRVAILPVVSELPVYPNRNQFASRFEVLLTTDDDVSAAQGVIEAGPQHQVHIFEEDVPLPEGDPGVSAPLALINRFIVE